MVVWLQPQGCPEGIYDYVLWYKAKLQMYSLISQLIKTKTRAEFSAHESQH